MGFNVWNDEERKILCIRNDENGLIVASENHHLLKVGKEYTISDVEVHSWYTLVSLKEFPNKQFNSVIFEEIEDTKDSDKAN